MKTITEHCHTAALRGVVRARLIRAQHEYGGRLTAAGELVVRIDAIADNAPAHVAAALTEAIARYDAAVSPPDLQSNDRPLKGLDRG